MSEITMNFNEQAREAEKAVLGGLMLETERFDSVILKISDQDFHGKDHQLIFESMGELINENKPLDPLTVSEKLDSKNLLNKIGGKDYLIALATETPTAANLEAYAEIIRQRSVARQLMKANSEIAELINNPQGMDGFSLLDEAERRIFSLNEEANRSQSSIRSMKELIPKSIDTLHQLAESGSKLLGSSTGFRAIDNKLQGLQDGDLIVVAGRPSMGKTAFAMNIVEHTALNQDRPVLVFSLEMPANQLVVRMLSSLGKIDQTRMRSGNLLEDDWPRLSSAAQKLKKASLYIDDTAGISPFEMKNRIKKFIREEVERIRSELPKDTDLSMDEIVNKSQPSLIVVDYLQLMNGTNASEGRVQEISQISRELKGLARDYECPVIALSQLSRNVEQRPNKRPVNADLRESGAIEQDADVVTFIYRDEIYNEDSADKGIAEIIIGKQRNGPVGTCKLAFMGKYTRFENLAREYQRDQGL